MRSKNPVNHTQKETVYIQAESPHSMRDFKKSLQRLAQIAYYQAGKIVVQTLLPLHPPVALITLDLSGITTATSADTYIPMDGTFNIYRCSFLESRLIGLYGGKATSSLLNYQYLVNSETLLSNLKRNETKTPYGGSDNNFQSNIGTQEIHTATRLAAAMVNNWDFYSSQSLKLLNETAISPFFELKSKILKENSRGFTTKFSDDVIFACKGDGINSLPATSLFSQRLVKQRSKLANNFVSKNSEELYYSSLENNRPLRFFKSYIRCLEHKNTLAIDSHGEQASNFSIASAFSNEVAPYPFLSPDSQFLRLDHTGTTKAKKRSIASLTPSVTH